MRKELDDLDDKLDRMLEDAYELGKSKADSIWSMAHVITLFGFLILMLVFMFLGISTQYIWGAWIFSVVVIVVKILTKQVVSDDLTDILVGDKK